MKKELAHRFNEEVDSYRNALLDCARKCEWETFKIKAGKLFDYVESVELTETERKFFTVFRVILFVLVCVIIVVFNMDISVHPGLQRLKNSVILMAIAGSCFELYFFLDFRMYMEHKTAYYAKRRENFIRNMERDFKNIAVETGACS